MAAPERTLAKERSPFMKWLLNDKTQRVLIMVSFMAAPLILLALFTYVPFLKMIQFSLYNRDYLSMGRFVGLQNYIDVFQREDIFGTLLVSVYYMVGGEGIYKACMFFPYLICGIAVGFIFKFFYVQGGVLDSILMLFGMSQENIPLWLENEAINNPALVATSVWRYMGQNMVLFLGAMMSVNSDLYEAAALDGANKWQTFKHIILPSISTIVTLNLITSISGSLSAFEPPYVITNGRFGTGTYFVVMNRIAHENQKVGLACAMAVVLLAIIFVCTIIQKVLMRKLFPNGSDAEAYRAAKEDRARRKKIREIERMKKKGAR